MTVVLESVDSSKKCQKSGKKIEYPSGPSCPPNRSGGRP